MLSFPAFNDGGRPQMSLRVLFQTRTGFWVEPHIASLRRYSKTDVSFSTNEPSRQKLLLS